MAGSGELHVEICVNDLKAYAQCELIVSPPTVTYKETMTEEVTEQLLTKTANKLNRLFGTSAPLDEKLVEMIENQEIDPKGDIKIRAKKLA